MDDYISLDLVPDVSVRVPGEPRRGPGMLPRDVSAEEFATLPPEAQQEILTSPFYRPVRKPLPK